MTTVEPSTISALRDIEREARRRLGSRVCDLHLCEHGNGIIISGTARTYYAKQMAQQVATELTAKPIKGNKIIVSSLAASIGASRSTQNQ